MLRLSARFCALSLLLALSGAALAQPQPTVAAPLQPALVPEAKPFVHVDALIPAEGGVLFSVTASRIDAVNILKEVAARTRSEIVVKTGTRALISNLTIQPHSPDKVIEEVCALAHLSCERREGIWFVSPLAEAKPKLEATLSELSMTDVNVADVLRMIADGFNLKIEVDPAIKNIIPFISLGGHSPRAAIALVAQAANLDVRENGDTLVISPKPRA